MNYGNIFRVDRRLPGKQFDPILTEISVDFAFKKSINVGGIRSGKGRLFPICK